MFSKQPIYNWDHQQWQNELDTTTEHERITNFFVILQCNHNFNYIGIEVKTQSEVKSHETRTRGKLQYTLCQGNLPGHLLDFWYPCFVFLRRKLYGWNGKVENEKSLGLWGYKAIWNNAWVLQTFYGLRWLGWEI